MDYQVAIVVNIYLQQDNHSERNFLDHFFGIKNKINLK